MIRTAIPEALKIEHRQAPTTQRRWSLDSTEPEQRITQPDTPIPVVNALTGAPTRRRILIVDDHPVIRMGLADLMNSVPDLQICGHAEDHVSALREVEALRPDLVILDLSLNGRSGLEVLKDIKARDASQRVLILSMHDESVYAPRALKAGASGYVMKAEAAETLITAIQQVLAGETYVSQRMARATLSGFIRGPGTPICDLLETLTDRELEVFRLIGEGKATREIARLLCVSAKTVDSHRTNIKKKLSVTSATGLVRRAIQLCDQPSRNGSDHAMGTCDKTSN
jgi:DNA-binding NarL/FixJ family response regulator